MLKQVKVGAFGTQAQWNLQSNRVPKIPQIKIPALADLVDLRFLDASERSELRKLPILATKLSKIVIF